MEFPFLREVPLDLMGSESLTRFDERLMSRSGLEPVDIKWLATYGLPRRLDLGWNWVFNSHQADFRTVFQVAVDEGCQGFIRDSRTVIARQYECVICVSRKYRTVEHVNLKKEFADRTVNSTLPQFTASVLCLNEYARLRNSDPDDEELADEQARAQMQRLLRIDPVVLGKPDSYWEDLMLDLSYGEPLDWR